MTTPVSIPAPTARALLMAGQGLLADPDRSATPPEVLDEVRALGFVQVDSINIVERAHHHILWARRHAYRPGVLDALQRAGQVFEHWTHDSSILPTEVFPHWRARFAHVAWGEWLRRKMGRNHREVARTVLDRIRAEGPLMARDFEHPGRTSGAWWDWKPAKAALEFWWRTGELAVPRRINFQKVYDLTERVLPEVHALPAPSRDEHVDWACRGALDRLGAATPREIAGFWGTVTLQEARSWCRDAVARGAAVAARLEHDAGDGPARPGVAIADWQQRAASLPPAPEPMRLLSPFDPLIRDRARALRLFNFDYRFEAFTPGAKRRYGYYVLPVLTGDRLVARINPRMDSDAGVLHVEGVWWEAKPSRADRAMLRDAIERYARLMDARGVRVAR